MRMTRTASICIIAGFFVLSMLTLPIFRVSATSTTIAVNPAVSYAALNSTVVVEINVTDVANLTAWQFYLYFPSSVLNCTDVIEGPFLKSAGHTLFYERINNNYNSTYGRVSAYSALLGQDSVNGDGVLATVTFQALGKGDTPLDLANVVLADEEMPPQLISHLTMNGQVIVPVPEPVPEPASPGSDLSQPLVALLSAGGITLGAAYVRSRRRRKKAQRNTTPVPT
jgi:hypothetical protein